MEPIKNKPPAFDDIVFEYRNREYGAYLLRKNYRRNLVIALFTGILLICTAAIVPYLKTRAQESRVKKSEREVMVRLENLDQPEQAVIPPPAPPPPAEAVQQARYAPPVVVDSVRPEEMTQLMTADEAREDIRDEEVVEYVEEIKEEVQEEEPEPEPFVIVEEMPMFPGGDRALMEFIYEHIKYPEVAKENNIQGRIFLKFCVTSKGTVDLISITKGVDPELDKEAMRVVSILPLFNPGKQGGKPVPVWYSIQIRFQLM